MKLADKMVIRELTKNDCLKCAEMHLKTYPKYLFTSKFSIKMLKNYYETLLSGNKFSFVMEDDNEIFGAVMIGEDSSKARNLFIKSNFVSLLLVVLKNPQFLFLKFLDLMRSIIKKDFNSKYRVRLTNILVDSSHNKSKGASTNLLNHAFTELKKENIQSLGWSVRSNNVKAINYYIKIGAKVEKIVNNSLYFFKIL